MAYNEVCPQGFYLVRNDRNRSAGGVAFMISDCIRFKPRYDLHNNMLESVWIELLPLRWRVSVPPTQPTCMIP